MQSIIVSNKDIIRKGIAHTLLGGLPQARVISEVGSLESAVKAAGYGEIDAVFLDDTVLNDNTLAFEKYINELYKKCKVKFIIAFVSRKSHNTLVTRLMNLPIAGIISDEAENNEMLELIQKVWSGERYVSPSLRESMHGALSSSDWKKQYKSPFDKLSEQEFITASLLLNNVSVSTIGEKLRISRRTVHTYRYRIFEKLNIENEHDLLKLALEWGMLKTNMKNITLQESFLMFLKRNASMLIALSAAAFVMIWGVVASEHFVQSIVPKVSWLINQFGASVLYLSSACLLIALGIICSPIGNIRLGDERPEFSTWTWISMIAAAGFVFFPISSAVLRPIIYAHSSDLISSTLTDPNRRGMFLSMMGDGLHIWALMAFCAVAVAIPAYFFKSSMLASEIIRLGFNLSKENQKHSKLLSGINVVTALTIVFGLSATLTGAIYFMRSEFELLSLFKEHTFAAAIITMLIMGGVFLMSTVSGLREGIRRMSQINAVLILLFISMVLIYFYSDIGIVLSTFFQTLIDYIVYLPSASVALDTEFVAKPLANKLYNSWYWSLSYAPFVGTFAAIISQGRTLRALLSGVIIFPAAMILFWYSVLGGLALAFDAQSPAAFAEILNMKYSFGYLAVFFEHFTAYPQLFAIVAIVLAGCLIVTSADSGCYVIAYQFEQRNLMRSIRIRKVWCLVVLAITLMLVSLQAHKVNYAVAILGSSAFALVLLLKIMACGLLLYRRFIHGKPIKMMEYVYKKQYTPFLEGGEAKTNAASPYNISSHTENFRKQ